MTLSGSKFVVICNANAEEFDTIEKAQSAAEAASHKHSADAYILKPIRKVSPKRDVVTTEL